MNVRYAKPTILAKLKSLIRPHHSLDTVEHGIKCSRTDELTLLQNLNNFLGRQGRGKMSKAKPDWYMDPGRQDTDPQYEYYYCASSGKEHPGWFIDLCLNADSMGRARFPNHPECAWTLVIGQIEVYNKTPGYHEVVREFFRELIESVGYPTCILRQYGRNECRR